MRKLVCFLALWPTVVGADSALTAEEMHQELFGVHLYGVETNQGLRWDECIAPSGETVYRFGDAAAYSQQGELTIKDGPLACFAYPPGSGTPACWRVIRHRGQLAFIPRDGGAMFVTTRIERDVQSCPPPFAQLSRY